MAHAHTKYADFEALRDQAVALRREGLSRRQIRDRLHVDNNDILNRLLEGEPPPEWTTRPNAKDDLKARARELRLQGWTYDQIQVELGCSKSSISLWARDLPKPEPRYTPEEQQMLMREGLAVVRQAQATERRNVKLGATKELGDLTDRELFILGIGLYWAEGQKSKPYARRESVNFVNSDPDMINAFLAWLDLLGVERKRLRFRVMIHESADIKGAEAYWADLVGVDPEVLQPTTIKKHNPKTVRKNTGEDYRGCLVIRVQQGGDLYCRIEGWWKGIAADVAVRLR